MKKIHPESLMMTHGYHPGEYGGAVKCPVFHTSTFAFSSAEAGKRQFELAYGLDKARPGEALRNIYSRISNPNLEVVEKRLALWDEAEEGALFSSGMAAISNTFFTFLRPGDLLLHSHTLYGGTSHFIAEVLPQMGIQTLSFAPSDEKQDILDQLRKSGRIDRLRMIYAETPSNPTNQLVDIAMLRELTDELSKEGEVILAVDNTYMGPVWQQPIKHGADLVLYSATKYIAGHSDLIAGACLGKKQFMEPIRNMRTFLGNMADPQTAWLISRSLETLKVRMDRQAVNARKVADFLAGHPLVENVYYPGQLEREDGRQFEIFQKQCSTGGAMIAFDIKGGESEAFAFLNGLKLVKLAVSLGSTESLAEHPASMTHAGVPAEERIAHGITDQLVRLSVGLEHYEDLIDDLSMAFGNVHRMKNANVESVLEEL